VVADVRAPRDGAYLEWIGNYDPMADPPAVTIKKDRAEEWLSKGAQPSDAVKRILHWDGMLEREHLQQTPQRKKAEAQAPAAAPAVVAVAETPPEAAEERPDEIPTDETEPASGVDDDGSSESGDSDEAPAE